MEVVPKRMGNAVTPGSNERMLPSSVRPKLLPERRHIFIDNREFHASILKAKSE
jgi:hypothetical protein